MNEPLLSLRENPEAIVVQCVDRLEKMSGRHPADREKYLALTLVEALADSVDAMDPERFMRSLDACGAMASDVKDTPCLAGMIAAMEEVVLEWELDAEHTRFLWALFLKARTKSVTTDPEGTVQGSGEAVLRTLKKEIEERKRAEEKLREGERKFRDIAELSPQVIFEHNTDGLVTFANKQGLELFGYTEEDLQKCTIKVMGLFPAHEHPAVRENLAKAVAGERGTTGYEYRAQRKDGTTFPAIIYTAAIFRNDKLAGFRGVLVDITRLKDTDKKLREREHRFRDLAESMPQVIFEMDEKGVITFANKQAFEIFGYDERDLSGGIEAFSLFSADELPRLRANLQKVAEGSRAPGNEYTAVRKDGFSFPVIIHVARIMIDDHLTGYRGIIIDVTERKKTEEELKRAHKELDDRNSFLDALLAAIPTPVFYKDKDGRYLGCNRAFTDKTGFTSEEMKGKTVFDIWPAEHASFFELKDREVMETGQPRVFEHKIRDRSGNDCSLIFYKDVYRYADGTVAGVVGSSMDITERARAEEALKQGEQRLRQIIDLVPHFIFAKDIDGRFILANKAVADTYGTTVDDLIGKVDARFTPSSEQVEHFRNDDLEVMTQGTTKYIPDEPITDSGGNVRYLQTVKIPFTFSGTQTPAVLGVSVDITERKRAERKIAESEEELRTIISASPIGIGRTRNRILEWKNEAMCRITGYTFEDPRGKDARNLYQNTSEFERIGEALYRDGQAETKWVTKNGEVRDILLQVSPMDDNAYIYTASDITRLRHAENALKFTQFSVDRAGDSVYWINESGAIAYVNDSACLATGYDRHELLSMTILEIDQGYSVSGWPQFWKEIVRKGSDQFESTHRRKDGTIFPVEVSLGYLSYNEFQYICAFTRDITERRKAEEALRNSEERWQFALEGAGDGLWDWNTLTGKIYFSRQWKQMIGFAENEIGDTIHEWNRRIHPDDRDKVHAKLNRHLEGKSSTYISQYRFRCKDGTYRWILDRGKVITRDEDGKPLRIIGTHTDITEHKKTEERLRLDERRTDALLKLNQMADRPLNEITDFTLEESIRLTGSTLGYLAFLNEDESVLTMHSWSRQAMEQCRVRNKPVSYPIETTGLWGDPVRRRRAIITNNYAAPDTIRKGYPKGHVTVNRHLGVPLFDGENIVALIGVANKDDEYGERDINQLRVMAEGMLRLLKQKTAQEALSISESRLRAIIDSAKDAIFIKNRDHLYIVANRAMSELFGIPMEGIIGRSDRELFMDEAASHIETVDARVLQGETIEEEMPLSIGTSTHIFHTIKVPLRNDSGGITGLCGIARDVTERKHLESQLLQSQKMEAVGTLAGGVAHDFNNLLSAIMGYASLLQMKMEKNNPLYAYASQILVSSEKAANLTHSLLAFSRKQVINLKPVVINDTVDKLHRLLERLIPEDVEFRITRNTERLVSLADPGQLDQVIMNLVTNARDAMPRGGKLTISVDRVAIDDDFVMTRGYGKPAHYALIAITDTGIGMDAKTVAKIFEPFFTTKGVGRGTGLGLAIVYGIIKQHNGYIDVRSKPGEGSTFSVYLPLVWLEPANEEAAPEITGGTETILIAEDNNELCELSVKVLEDHGYTVLPAKDGSLAVEAFREHKGDISLVILDVVMPKMNGKEACEAIRNLDPSVKVIFTSGYTDDIIEQKGVNDRYDFLGKPITPGTLLKKIREVLDR